MKIINKHKRESYSEGRNFGIGYAILNKISDDTFEALNAFTACKDYLNDLVYIENTKKDLPKVYGFKYKLTNYFDDKDFFYLGVNTLNYNNPKKEIWKGLDECNKILLKNSNNLLKFINKLEEEFNIFDSRTKLIYKTNNFLILKVPIYWFTNGPLISLYTLFIRCIFHLKYDEKKSFLEIMSKVKTFIADDSYLIKQINNIFSIEDYATKLKDFTIDSSGYKLDSFGIHNFGIKAWITYETKRNNKESSENKKGKQLSELPF